MPGKNDWYASRTWNHPNFDQLNLDDKSTNVAFDCILKTHLWPKVILQAITKPEILNQLTAQAVPKLGMGSGRDNLIDQRSAKLLSAGLVFVTGLTTLDIRSLPLSQLKSCLWHAIFIIVKLQKSFPCRTSVCT